MSMTPVPSVEPDVVTRSSMLAVVAGALTVTLTAGSIVLGLADDVPPAAPGLAGAVFGVTGGLVASRRPRLVIGWMLLVVRAFKIKQAPLLGRGASEQRLIGEQGERLTE